MGKRVYEPGEWVLTGAYQNRGFVVESNEFQTQVVVTSHGNGTQIPVKFEKEGWKITSVTTSGLRPAPELPKVFSYEALDLALMTRDREWYQEIMSLKEVRVDE